MRLLLNLSQSDYGVNIRPREVDIDAPESDDLSGTFSYNLGAYHTESGYGDSWSSGYLNARNWISMGVDHVLIDGSGYVNESSSDTQMNAVMWERLSGDALRRRHAERLGDAVSGERQRDFRR